MTKTSGIDGRIALRGGILGAWAAFFIWLWLSGEMSRYLGPRTYWVIPFGAVTLGGAALAHVYLARSTSPRHIAYADVGRSVLLIVPLIAAVMVPNADLGALAASRKATGAGLALANVPTGDDVDPIENPGFKDVHYADESDRYARATGVVPGKEVILVGFVSEDGGDFAGSFDLTRFYVSCCAADAIPYSVAIEPPSDFSGSLKPDTWLRARGPLELRGDRLVVAATTLEAVPEPEDPYLY